MTNSVTFDSLVYTCAAASRITGEDIVSISYERLHDRYWCFPEGKNAIPVKASQFRENFAEWRRQRGKQITDIKQVNDYTYRVKGKYTVSVFPDCLDCDCQDWLNQDDAGVKTPCCKHAYAVLNHLGCSSLAEFIKKQEATSTPSKAKKVAPELFPIQEKTANDYSIVYQLVFETYALDPDEESPIPLETVEVVVESKPTPKEITQFRRDAHKQGFQLVAIEPQKRYHHDEF